MTVKAELTNLRKHTNHKCIPLEVRKRYADNWIIDGNHSQYSMAVVHWVTVLSKNRPAYEVHATRSSFITQKDARSIIRNVTKHQHKMILCCGLSCERAPTRKVQPTGVHSLIYVQGTKYQLDKRFSACNYEHISSRMFEKFITLHT